MVSQNKAAFAEESAEVQVLLASLSKTTDLTKRIASSLSRLDASGKIVKDAIEPIYSNTQQLQVTSRNIERLNEAIEKLRQPLDAKGREEGIIRAGPRSSGLPQYLGALRRIDKALSDLAATNLRANQQAANEFQNLLSTGVNQLQELYRESLLEDAHTVEPLHYITKQLAFPTYEKEKASYLSEIASAIVSASAHFAKLGKADSDPGVRLYAEIRGDYLSKSLQNLATASINTSKKSTNDNNVYRHGSNAIGMYAGGIEGMFLAEHENVSRVFQGETRVRVFTRTCESSLQNFSRTLAELNNTIKSRVLTDCFLAYEIIDLITPLSYRLEKRTGLLRAQMSEALRPVRDTARASLGELLSRTKAQAEAITTLPPDGRTVPIAHETAARLQSLGQFDKPLVHLLSSIGDGGWRQDPNSQSSGTGIAQSSQLNLSDTSGDGSPALLSHYLSDLLDTLLNTLSSKVQTLHRTKPLQGIFMLNTIAVVSRAIDSSEELRPYISSSARLDGPRKTNSSLYLIAWKEPSSQLLDTITTGGGGGGSVGGKDGRPLSGSAFDSTAIIKSLGSKDKDRIKEKFKMFNATFDEQVARHKSLFMEKEVRRAVQKEIQAMIEPLYARFWDRYHEVDKGKGKTVKYSKGELVQLLASL